MSLTGAKGRNEHKIEKQKYKTKSRDKINTRIRLTLWKFTIRIRKWEKMPSW